MRHAALFAIVCLTVTQASAVELKCGLWENVNREFAKQGFRQTGVGMVGQKMAMTIFQNDEVEEWAIFSVDVDGQACLISTGKFWTTIKKPTVPVPGERPS